MKEEEEEFMLWNGLSQQRWREINVALIISFAHSFVRSSLLLIVGLHVFVRVYSIRRRVHSSGTVSILSSMGKQANENACRVSILFWFLFGVCVCF